MNDKINRDLNGDLNGKGYWILICNEHAKMGLAPWSHFQIFNDSCIGM